MKARLPETVPGQEVVLGHAVRFKKGTGNGERAEVLVDGEWLLLWSSRSATKGGKNAWTLLQQDLVRAVWEKVHGHKPETCPRCKLIVEDVDPRILSARACRVCQLRGTHV